MALVDHQLLTINLAQTCHAHIPHIFETFAIALCGKITLFFRVFLVRDVSLSYSSVPYKGVLQITTDSGTKNVCWQSSLNLDKDIVCHHLGYYNAYSLVNISTPTDAKDATFPGSINCNGEEKYLSQCSINALASESCSGLSYIECIPARKIYKTRYERNE